MALVVALFKYLENGTLDRRFGNGGIAIGGYGAPSETQLRVGSLTTDSADRLVVGCIVDDQLAVYRFLPDGKPDPTFGGEGSVRFDFFSSASESGGYVAVDDADRIYIAGTADRGDRWEIAVARLRTDGDLDTSFGGDGKVLTRFASLDDVAVAGLTLDRLQRPVVAGRGVRGAESFVALARYRANGALDLSFDRDGKVLFGPGAGGVGGVVVDDADRIVVAGGTGGDRSRILLMRFRSDGTRDPSFGVDGRVETEFYSVPDESASDVTVDSRGRVVIVGYARTLDGYRTDEAGDRRFSAMLAARYLNTGELDTSFSFDGKALVGNLEHYGASVSIASGRYGSLYLGGVWGPYVPSQDEGSPVRLGASDVGIARLTDNGQPARLFGGTGVVEYPVWVLHSAASRFGSGLAATRSGQPVVAFALDLPA